LYLTFGWKAAKSYVFLLGKLYFSLNKKEKHQIKEAVFQVIGSRNQVRDTKDITKKVFDGILSHYYEKLFIAFEEPEKAGRFLNQTVRSEDWSVLNRKLLKGNGVILVTGHYGAIEYLPTLLAINNFPTSLIARFKTTQLKKKVYSQAEKYNIRLIDGEETGNVIRSAIKELRENRILVTLCDEIEEWRPSAKKRMSFLGRVTFGDRTINIIRERTGAEIVFGIIHRYSLNKYKLIMYAYEDMLRLLDRSSTFSVGETVLKFLERYIYANPEQWYEWKKYPEIEMLPAQGNSFEKPAFPLVLKPTFDRASSRGLRN
jgi:lauroyl/myristoyl acyltransferase